MKKTLSTLIIAAFIGTGSLAMATSSAPPEAPDIAGQESAQDMQDSFSGLVKKTEAGLILQTGQGDYTLKGLDLEEVVGKEVLVTGIVRNENDANVLYVVKALPKD